MTLHTNIERDVILMNLEEQLTKVVSDMYDKRIEDCDDQELYYSVLTLTKQLM